jgi:hypothetical protein
MKTKPLNVTYLDENRNVRHKTIQLKEGTLTTLENVSNALYEELEKAAGKSLAEVGYLYKAIKEKYEKTKPVDAPDFDRLSIKEQKELGFEPALLTEDTHKVRAIIGWSKIEEI